VRVSHMACPQLGHLGLYILRSTATLLLLLHCTIKELARVFS